MIRDDVNRSWSSFEVVLPDFEGFENGQEFLVMYIVVQLHGVESLGVKGDWMYLIVCWRYCGQNCCWSIVGGVGFDNEWSIRNPMHKDQSSREGFFKCFK